MKKKTIIFLTSCLFCVVNAPSNVNAEENSLPSTNRIHFINTKAQSGSDAILLESNGHYALIDMGEDYDFPDGSNPLYPMRHGIAIRNYQVLEDRLFRHLGNVGVKKFDFILGTHVHSDHIGGADEVLSRFPVDKFYLKKYSDNRITSNWGLWDNLFNYNNALRAAKDKGVKVIQDIADKDSHFKLGDMDIQLFNYKNEYDPDGNLRRVPDDNTNSIVVVITVNGKRIYLGGDLDNSIGKEDELGPKIGKVDMMKWNHHYDTTISNTVNFVNNLSPKIIVQTTGADMNSQERQNDILNRGIQLIHATSKTQNATVFDVTSDGFKDISNAYPNIPTVQAKWYQEDGFWKYRMSDDEMAIGWQKIDGKYYFFNGKGQMQHSKWIFTNDSWVDNSAGEYYYVNDDGSMQPGGWFKHDGSWYYIQSDGIRRQSELAEIGGSKYLFDKDGKMLTGWQTFNGKEMLFADSGALILENEQASSWKKINNKWYYFDDKNQASVGFKEINGVTYYFDPSGVMQTGWQFVDGAWYLFANSGAMKKGWAKEGSTWYYLDNKDGKMVTGTQEIAGDNYYFNASGEMQTGWKWLNDAYYFYQASGSLKKGWYKENNQWYYLDANDGKMLRGSHEIAGDKYYFDANGVMQTGWKWLDDAYYFYQASGSLKKGWYKENNKWYYLNEKDGKMVTGTQEIAGDNYYFNASGEMQTGWKWFDGAYYFYQASGSLKKGWYKENNKWYYLNEKDGKMLTGIQEISGDKYYLNASGEMQTGWKWFDGYYHYFKASGAMLLNGITPDGYKVDGEGRWLRDGETTTTTSTTTTTTTATTVQETTENTTLETTTQETTTVEKIHSNQP